MNGILKPIARPRTASRILPLVRILAQGKLLLKLAAQVAQGSDQLLADADQGLAGRDGAVRLDPDEDLRHVRVAD